jgi:hypothetical protein
MKKVNFCKKLINLQGKNVKGPDGEDIDIKTLVSNCLVQVSAKDNAARQFSIARKIYETDGIVELEDADYEMVKSCVKKNNFSCLAENAILECMEQIEEPDEECDPEDDLTEE